jgi:hypothetical protein
MGGKDPRSALAWTANIENANDRNNALNSPSRNGRRVMSPLPALTPISFLRVVPRSAMLSIGCLGCRRSAGALNYAQNRQAGAPGRNFASIIGSWLVKSTGGFAARPKPSERTERNRILQNLIPAPVQQDPQAAASLHASLPPGNAQNNIAMQISYPLSKSDPAPP